MWSARDLRTKPTSQNRRYDDENLQNWRRQAFPSSSEPENDGLAALNSRSTLFKSVALKDNAEDINREEGQMEALQHRRIK